jgi:hypothetical protein
MAAMFAIGLCWLRVNGSKEKETERAYPDSKELLVEREMFGFEVYVLLLTCWVWVGRCTSMPMLPA